MTPDIGQLALLLALGIALVQSVVPLLGAKIGHAHLATVGRTAAASQFLLLTVSLITLAVAFLNNDFSVSYVSQNSNTALPWFYRIAAIWGGHEGSVLLWVWMLSAWGLAVALKSPQLPVWFRARVLAVMGMVSLGFLLFIVLTSNPFARQLPLFPLQGRDLNPLLQDVGLVIHPPMLYMGYVGFSVAFAFAVAALLSPQQTLQKVDWAGWARPWALLAWASLTVGILLGSWWAYYELGWGGWWFWDPVENASFMPWLAGTAFIHSLIATQKRQIFQNWSLLLAITAFALSLLGTFLVRSGILTSVHAFANDPERGLFILLLLAINIGGALLLFWWRGLDLRQAPVFKPYSRESFLLANNVIMTVACFVVLLGTLFPLIADVLGFGRISVGPPYFNTLFVPLSLAVLALLGVGPLLRWKEDQPFRLGWWFILQGVAACVMALVVAWWLEDDHFWRIGLFALIGWMVISHVGDIVQRLKQKTPYWYGLLRLPPAYLGMMLAHLGFAVSVIGITGTSLYSVEKDMRLSIGESVEVADYRFQFDGLGTVEGPNYQATRATLSVFNKGEFERYMYPEKRRYDASGNVLTEVALDPGVWRDLYVAMGEPLDDNSWAMRFHIKPMIRWIWAGGLMMAIGGLLACRRRRLIPRRELSK